VAGESYQELHELDLFEGAAYYPSGMKLHQKHKGRTTFNPSINANGREQNNFRSDKTGATRQSTAALADASGPI